MKKLIGRSLFFSFKVDFLHHFLYRKYASIFYYDSALFSRRFFSLIRIHSTCSHQFGEFHDDFSKKKTFRHYNYSNYNSVTRIVCHWMKERKTIDGVLNNGMPAPNLYSNIEKRESYHKKRESYQNTMIQWLYSSSSSIPWLLNLKINETFAQHFIVHFGLIHLEPKSKI